MKKITLLVASVLLTMGLIACQSPSDVKAPEETPETPIEEPAETPVEEGEEEPGEETEEEPVEIVIPEVGDEERFETKMTVEEAKEFYAENEEMSKLVSYFVGKEAPALQVNTLDGATKNLSDFKGEPVIVEFMASWCPVCEKVKPEIEEYKKMEGASKVVSVGMFDEADALKTFAGEAVNDYLISTDPQAVLDNYYINFVPVFFFINEDGVVEFIYSGDVTAETLKEHSDKVFN